MRKLLFGITALVMISGCVTEPSPTPPPPPDMTKFQIQTDVDSCVRDPLQPWCQEECKLSIRDWCQ